VLGVASLACPDCHGTLWDVGEGGLEHYRCRVGHSYSPQALYAAQAESLERALWAALRALEERQDLSRRLQQMSVDAGRSHAASYYRERLEAAANSASVIRDAMRHTLVRNRAVAEESA
jgi:two-component system chemotaxis response regulator CheB